MNTYYKGPHPDCHKTTVCGCNVAEDCPIHKSAPMKSQKEETPRPFKRIMVELNNGVMVDITALPKDAYEYFLELTRNIHAAYIAINSNRK